MTVPVDAGVNDALPALASLPLHAPLAEQLVAFVDDHDKLILPPMVMLDKLLDSVTVGNAGAVTVRVAELFVVPPGPVQLIVYS